MQLHYERYGAGPPLIILHGLFGSLENWRTLSKTFGRSFTVFAVDQRNHGRSPHSNTMNYQVMAEDLIEFMHQQSLSSAFLLGHLMGGKTAMQFASTFPEAADKLVVVDIAPKAYPPGHEDIFDALFAIDVKALHTRQEAEVALAGNIRDLAVRQFLLKNLERQASGTFRWRINLDGIHNSYAEILKGITTSRVFAKPTLFIKGGQSEYIQEMEVAFIRQIFPRSHLVTLPSAGHWAHAEAPQEFATIVMDFLLEQ